MRRPLKPSVWWLILPVLMGGLILLDRPRATDPMHSAVWVDAGGVKLRAVLAGQGDTTVLLLHGFGESLFTWRALLDQLALGRRVLAVDLPGFGGSEKPDMPYTLEAMASHLEALVDEATTGPVVVVGHSMGGELATQLAIDRPDRIVALALIAPAGWSVGLGGVADTMYPSKARALGWYFSSRAFLLPEHDPAWLGEPEPAADHTLMVDPEYRRAAARVLQEFDFTALRSRFRAVSQPTLLIWGTLDPVIPFEVADSIRAQLRCARLVPLRGALHRPQVEVPGKVLAELNAFLASPHSVACGRDAKSNTSIS